MKGIRKRLFLFFVFCCGIVVPQEMVAQGTWKTLANPAPDANYGVMLLLSDGSVMVKTNVGGTDSIGNGWNKLTPDNSGSYTNGTWTIMPPMIDTRLAFSSQVLRDGRVYVAGGEYGTGIAKCEIYDPVNNVWNAGPPLPGGDSIYDANSEILPDGRVLQAVEYTHGFYCNRTLIFNPLTNTYSVGSTSHGRHSESTWVKLADNSILFINQGTKLSERYIPSLNGWIYDASLPDSLYDAIIGEIGPAFLLPDGRAIFFGATGRTAYYTPTGDITPGNWVAGPQIPNSLCAPDAPGAMMANGKILCAFGHIANIIDTFPTQIYFYEFDYLTNAFTSISPPYGITTLNTPLEETNMLNLPDGSILFTDGTNHYYQYVPDGTPLTAGKPIINSIIKVACDTYMATGNLFNGISVGSDFGDDWQMSTNYPIVRLSSGTNVYYARSFNWNSNGLMRGSLPDTTWFVLQNGMPEGVYSLQVVTNGNPSGPVSFSTCSYTGIEMIGGNLNDILVFPNPATTCLTVTSSNKINQVSILNLIGQTVYTHEYNTEKVQIDVADLPKGMYLVKINGSEVRKFVKE